MRLELRTTWSLSQVRDYVRLAHHGVFSKTMTSMDEPYTHQSVTGSPQPVFQTEEGKGFWPLPAVQDRALKAGSLLGEE
jgi:hypothetical protein